MTGHGLASRQTAVGLVVGAASVAVVNVVIGVLAPFIDPRGLGGLYFFAILPVAIGWDFWLAGLVAAASFLTFAYFFAPPLHSFEIARADTVATLVISVATAYVVSELGRRVHARAIEAEVAQQALGRLADEQAALRRVATLVAEGVPTAEVFEAVTREVGLRCDADLARMERFEDDGTVTAVAAWSRSGAERLAVGRRFALEGASIAAQILETGLPARVDSFQGASGPIAQEARAVGIRASVGCPIVVGGRTWGVIAASRTQQAPFPPETETRIADFTELVATAVANAEARAELIASRARLLSAGDDARRRLVRDLHDGAQQRLVHAIITLKLAVRAGAEGRDEEAKDLVDQVLEAVEQANAEVRELAHGILPGVLAHGGLAAGVQALVSRLRVPVRVAVRAERLPPAIEANAYFIVAEALTNVAKHADANSADVRAWVHDSTLHVDVRDDGVGGARPDGSGLLGLHDRVSALGGRLDVESPPGRGTHISATLPLSP